MRILSCYLSLLLALSSVSPSYAASHLVPAAELRAALSRQSEEREADLAEIRSLLNDEAVRDQFGSIANLNKIEASIANLDDETLRDFANQSRRVNADVSAAGKAKIAIILVVAIIVGSILLNLIPREYGD
jgi:hypothetical protein